MPSSRAALSRRRSEVVPTATMPPAPRARRVQAAAVAALTEPHSACMRCSPVSSAFTGRKVPAPDVQGDELARPRRGRRGGGRARREMQPGRGRRDGAVLAGVDGLVVAQVLLVGRPACRRCRAAAACSPRRRSPVRAGPAKVEAQRRLRRPRPSPRPRRRGGRAGRPLSAALAEADAVADRQLLRRAARRPSSDAPGAGAA